MTDGAEEASCGTNRAFYNHDREHKEEKERTLLPTGYTELG